MQEYSRNFGISSLTMQFDFYPSTYFINEPHVFVTLWDAATNLVSVVNAQTVVAGLGSVYTSVTITFPSGYVGKKGSLLIRGD
jgi:hypothetical protein